MNNMGDTFTFCPICQLPLKAVNILPDLHVAQCMSIISEDNNIDISECPNGIHCLSTDLFHYRDFSHKLLAAYRSSADYVPPDVDLKPTPKKKNITPKRSSRKQKTPVKINLKNNYTIESDSDSDVIIPLKNPCRKLSFNENIECLESKNNDKKRSHSNKSEPLNEPIISTVTESVETLKSAEDCDIMMTDSELTSEKTFTDTKSIEVKCNTLKTNQATNLIQNSSNVKLSEIKSNQIKENVGLNKINSIDKDPDNNFTEIISNQDDKKLKPRKNFKHDQTNNSKNDLEDKYSDVNSNHVKEKLELNHPIDISEQIPQVNCFELTCSQSIKNPEVTQEINEQINSGAKLSRIPAKKVLEQNQAVNAEEESENEYFDSTYKVKKKIKLSQTFDVLEKSPGTRYSQRMRNQKLIQQSKKQISPDKNLLRRMSGQPKKNLEQNQTITGIKDLQDECFESNSSQVKKKLKLSTSIDESKISLDEKFSEKRTDLLKKNLGLNHQINIQQSSDKLLPRRQSGQPKKNLKNNQAISAQEDSKCCVMKSEQVKKNLKSSSKDVESIKSPKEKCSLTKSSPHTKNQALIHQINIQKAPDEKLSRRIPGRPRKKLELKQTISASGNVENEETFGLVSKPSQQLIKSNGAAKQNPDRNFSENNCIQHEKSPECNLKNIQKSPDETLRRKPGQHKERVEHSQTVVRQTDCKDECFNEQNSAYEGSDEQCTVAKCSQEKDNLIDHQTDLRNDENIKDRLVMSLSDELQRNTRSRSLIRNVDLNSGESVIRINNEGFISVLDGITHYSNEIKTTKKDEIITPKTSSDLTHVDDCVTSSKLSINIESKMFLKSSRCVIKRLELSDQLLKNSTSINNHLEKDKNTNDQNIENRLDFDDIIPGSRLDKELLRNIERNQSNSPTVSIHTCSSDYNASASVSSSSYSLSEVEDEVGINAEDCPSSPEVLIQPNIKRMRNVLISSSSDSDLPLAFLAQNKTADKLKKNKADANRGDKTGRVLHSLKSTPIKNNCQFLTSSEMSANSDNDSGKSSASKNSSTISIVQGKEVGGKILRTPKNSPACLNGHSMKPNSCSEIASSDKESDSGKSSGSKDSSFIPSERDSTTHPSDSAFSAESSENLASSTSSTYTSSGDISSDNKSSDPSYSTDSEHVKLILKNRKQKNNQSSQKYKNISQSLSGESSDISLKEKTLFSKAKKSPLERLENNSKHNKSNGNVYTPCECSVKKEWQSVLTKMRSSCFPSDLKIDSEDSLTVASSCSSSDTSRSSMTLPLRQCPFYKRIPDTPFAVDAFQYWNIPGVRVYFLSHYHSDHYIGLKKSFAKPIYCSRITANLVRMHLRVEEKWLRILELNEPQAICGVEVTALDANHCPGSMMFLFCLTNGQNYLHVGDFRGSKAMTKYPSLQRITISKLFLDTTYCSPQYCFPTQEEVIGKVIDIVKEQVKTKPRTLVVCGSYTIGKEKVFLGVAEALNWRVWARPNKQRVFSCLNDSRINSRLSHDPRIANVHVLPMASIQIMPLQQHLQSCSGAFTHVLGFKPTGWELSGKSQDFKVTTRDNITIYGVPYSEHSSFTELRDFVQFLEPREVVPTVNVGSAASRSKMSKYFSEWLRLQTSNGQPTKSQTKISQFFK